MQPIIRPESEQDRAAVHRVNEAAFQRPNEADLVDAVRHLASVSLVAELEGEVVGHILFTPVTVQGERDRREAPGLAPMAVLPEVQNQGIGSALVRAGLEACRRRGDEVVFVLGHPEYYPRFGFRALAGTGLHCKYVEAGHPAFMAAELKPGALEGFSGEVSYHTEFDKA
jgi:putative acetyltransferase